MSQLKTSSIFFLMILMSFSVYSYSGWSDASASAPFPPLSLPPFYKINCTDNMVINLSGTNDVPSVFIDYQPPRRELITEVVDGVLFMKIKIQKQDNNAPPPPPEAMVININSGPLKEVVARGNCQINAYKLQSYGMAIVLENSGNIRIEGDVKINKIVAMGNSEIELLWANSRQLFINGYDNARIKIAGTAKEIFVKARGSATIDAQFLRTNRVYALAKNEGFISVLPLCELRAFAEDHGRIDYYTVPYTAMSITQTSGNVLWMDYRN